MYFTACSSTVYITVRWVLLTTGGALYPPRRQVLGHVRQLRELQLVQSASLPADAGVAPLDAATAARLQVLHPKETHFGLSEAVLVLRKVGRSMSVQ